MNKKRLKLFASTTFLGIICCILVGVIFFRSQIFSTKYPSFQFIAFGLIYSVFFSGLKYFKIRNAIYMYVLMFLLHEILFRFSKTSFVVRDIFFFLSIGVAVYLFCQYFESKLDKLKFGKFLTFASLFAIANLVATLLLALIFQSAHFMQQLFTNISLGLLIGVGLGIGFELADNINLFWFKRTESA
jgi:hypothetical protein